MSSCCRSEISSLCSSPNLRSIYMQEAVTFVCLKTDNGDVCVQISLCCPPSRPWTALMRRNRAARSPFTGSITKSCTWRWAWRCFYSSWGAAASRTDLQRATVPCASSHPYIRGQDWFTVVTCESDTNDVNQSSQEEAELFIKVGLCDIRDAVNTDRIQS